MKENFERFKSSRENLLQIGRFGDWVEALVTRENSLAKKLPFRIQDASQLMRVRAVAKSANVHLEFFHHALQEAC